MVVIRMQRAGGKNKPKFRIVVADSRFQRDGRFLEKLGHYNPMAAEAECVIDVARADHWIGNGAQPSPAVAVLIKKARVRAAASASSVAASSVAAPTA